VKSIKSFRCETAAVGLKPVFSGRSNSNYELFPPDSLPVEQCTHRRFAEAHCALVDSFIVKGIQALFPVIAWLLHRIMPFLVERYLIELLQGELMEVFPDAIGR